MKKMIWTLSILLLLSALFFSYTSFRWNSNYIPRRHIKAVIANQDSILNLAKNKTYSRSGDSKRGTISLMTSHGWPVYNQYSVRIDEKNTHNVNFWAYHSAFYPDDIMGINDPNNLTGKDKEYLCEYIENTMRFLHSLNIVYFDGIMNMQQKAEGIECIIGFKYAQGMYYIPTFDSIDDEFKKGYRSVGSGWYIVKK